MRLDREESPARELVVDREKPDAYMDPSRRSGFQRKAECSLRVGDFRKSLFTRP
jgi:hypothetical protein